MVDPFFIVNNLENKISRKIIRILIVVRKIGSKSYPSLHKKCQEP